MAKNSVRGFQVRVFGDGDAAGNVACCFLFSAPQPQPYLLRLAQACGGAVCACWWRENALHVRCFLRAKPVQFCGHGLLACAYVHSQRPPPRGRAFAVIGGRRRCEFRRDDALCWLRVPRLACRAQPLPDSVAAQFRPAPQRMALAGPRHGYRIFEWPAGTDIAAVQVEPAYLASGERATILTAAGDGGAFDFTLRYLYGGDEDAATGSANAVLADYWLQRGLRPPYRARQRSPGGGVILSDVERDRVAIGGRVRIEREICADVGAT